MDKIITFAAYSRQQLCLELAKIKEAGKVPVLGLVFSSYQLGIQNIMDEFGIFPGITLFGASTCGEFLFNKDTQEVDEESAIVCLFEGQPDWFKFEIFDGTDLSSLQLGHKIGAFFKQSFADPALVLVCSGLTVNGQEIVEGIGDMVTGHKKVFGGLAGDDSRFHETYVFSKERVFTNGAVALAIDQSKVEISGIAVSGWIGIGADLTITRAEGNVVFSIDNLPALDVYKDHLSVRDEELPEIGVEFPLLMKKDGQDVLRAVLGVDRESKALIFAGTVPQGAIVNFSSSPGFDVIEKTTEAFDHFHESDPQADFLLLFSCMARHRALGLMVSEELGAIYENWQAPLAGFFTYGEIGTSPNQVCDFYNETCSLVKMRFLVP